jgi:lipoyl(octanoyl) transferase
MPPTGVRAFRFVLSGANDGAVNMAADEAVMCGIREGTSTPVLRLYTWDPPTISLGYFQSSEDIDFEACRNDRIGVVRRMTGGRAVLHSDEITYSILFGEEDFTPFRMKEIFLFIAQCLVDSLRILGIDSKIAEKTKGSLKSPNCFASPAQYEIESVQQGKLIGSAQVIKDGVVLQHGAIPLTGSYREISKYLRGDKSFKSASSLSQVSPAGGCGEGLVESLREGFAKRIPIERGALTERETTLTKELAASKYASRDWLHRK